MRAYFFTNMYLSGIHPGIQAGHASEQMWLDYLNDSLMLATLTVYATSHKTWIVLNGGDHEALQNAIGEIFQHEDNPYPWSFFTEPGLNNAVTAIGIIVPERLYDEDSTGTAREAIMDLGLPFPTRPNTYSEWEMKFLKYRVQCPLAR